MKKLNSNQKALLRIFFKRFFKSALRHWFTLLLVLGSGLILSFGLVPMFPFFIGFLCASALDLFADMVYRDLKGVLPHGSTSK